jgi:hypothetical protein
MPPKPLFRFRRIAPHLPGTSKKGRAISHNLKPLPFKGGVGVGFGEANLSLRERCSHIATTPTPPLKRRGLRGLLNSAPGSAIENCEVSCSNCVTNILGEAFLQEGFERQ